MQNITPEFAYLLGLIVSKGRINYSQKTIYVDFKHKDAEISGIIFCPEDYGYVAKLKKTGKYTCKNKGCGKEFEIENLSHRKWNQIESTKVSIKENIIPYIKQNIGVDCSVLGNSQVTILKLTFTELSFENITKILNYMSNFKNSRVPKDLIEQEKLDIQIEFGNGLIDAIGYFNRGNHDFNLRMRGYLQVVGNYKLTNDFDNYFFKVFGLPVQTIRWSHPNIVDSNLKDFNSKSSGSWARENQIKFYPENYQMFTPRILHKREMMEELIDFNVKNFDSNNKSYEHTIKPIKIGNDIKPFHPEENSNKLPKELRGIHIDKSWQISATLGSIRINKTYNLNKANSKNFLETGDKNFNNDLEKFIKEKEELSIKKFKEIEKNFRKKKIDKVASKRFLEKQTYPILQEWLKTYIKNTLNEEAFVLDSSRVNVRNIITVESEEVLEAIEDFSIKPDLIAFTLTELKIFIVESKITKITLDDIAQTIGYSKVIQPYGAYLVSTEEIAEKTLYLLDAYPEILNYGTDLKIKIGKLENGKVHFYDFKK